MMTEHSSGMFKEYYAITLRKVISNTLVAFFSYLLTNCRKLWFPCLSAADIILN